MATGVAQMAAILRTGKFLRLFSGVARNLAASSGGKSEENGLVSTTGLCFDSNFLNQANFSIQNVLPYLGVSDSGHAEDRFPTRLLSTPNRYLGRVTKSEIDAMIEEVKGSEVNSSNINLLSSQALLAIRLCGTVLDQESQSARSSLVNSIWSLVLEKKLPLTVVHYNALLRVHLENKYKFDPVSIQEDMKINGVEPDRETYQCFISSYCQEGNIDGASRILQTMKQKGYKVNENIFNSLIIGHSENGDLPRSQGILKVMRQCGLTPSTETYLTLTCAYAKHGDISAMERMVSECSSQDPVQNFRDGDFLELLFVLCENDHKDQVGKILAQLHPETEEFLCLASHMVVRLVNAGNDDVAYNLLQFTVENSIEDSAKLISSEFLEQLVKVNTPVSKLLWFLKDMAACKIHTGGLENLLDLSMKNNNISLSMKLADIMICDGGRISKKSFKTMVSMLQKVDSKDVTEHVLSCVKVGTASNLVTPDILKQYIFPLLDTWPELCIAQLEEYGLGRDQTVTPMIEYLVGRGHSDMAATVAGIFSEHVDSKLKFMASTTSQVTSVCNHFSGEISSVECQSSLPSVQSSDKTVICLANQLMEDGRIGDLELLLESECNLGDREIIYTNLITLYAKHKLIDRAINLSRRLRTEDQLKLPHFYEILGELIESQYQGNEQEQGKVNFSGNFETAHIEPYYEVATLPTTVEPQYMPTNSVYHYYYPMHGFFPSFSASDAATAPHVLEHNTSPMLPFSSPENDSSAETPTLSSIGCESYNSSLSQVDQGFLHRQLKRAVASGEAEKGFSVYLSLEKSGKVVNVTETSSLIEQLVRADMTHEATEITKTMLVRNTHPLPKIFRFLLNKLAVTGSVDDINAIGMYLSTKIKKDVSYDNRLCNAYLSAGRGAEFLDLLVSDLEMAVQNKDKEMMAIIQDRFPRGGAMGLLDNHPELLNKFSVLAKEFAKTGYIAPMNVLWTYHFINENEVAENIWEDYVKSSNQIMFQKVCQVARSTGNLKLAFGLVAKLSEADQVTPGARGIAYSCLLDCLCSADQSKRGWTVLQDALAHGVRLEDINRTALMRLKSGLETIGHDFPHVIPPKNKRDERSISPVDWNEM